MSEDDVKEMLAENEPEKEPEVEVDAPLDDAAAAEAAALAEAEGYPAQTVDGKLVRIVEKRGDATGQILIDSDGKEWTTEPHHGLLVAA